MDKEISYIFETIRICIMKESGVVISCFWHTDETVQKEELGMGEAELKDFDFRNVTFYHIAALAPARDDNQELNHVK